MSRGSDRGGGQELPFIILPGRRSDLGLEAARVREIVAGHAWEGPPPLDLLAFAGQGPAEAGEARVLVIRRSDGKDVPVRVVGRLRTQPFAAEQVLPLPLLLQPHAHWATAVIIPESGSALVIIDCDRLR
jgi:hypothetical protein